MFEQTSLDQTQYTITPFVNTTPQNLSIEVIQIEQTFIPIEQGVDRKFKRTKRDVAFFVDPECTSSSYNYWTAQLSSANRFQPSSGRSKINGKTVSPKRGRDPSLPLSMSCQ